VPDYREFKKISHLSRFFTVVPLSHRYGYGPLHAKKDAPSGSLEYFFQINQTMRLDP